MKRTRIIMGMPITIEIVDRHVRESDIVSLFDYFFSVDKTFSTYKNDSEISQFNAGKIALHDLSTDMRLLFALAEDTRQETGGYFNINHNGYIDPSGIVKGWAIYNASIMAKARGFCNFMIDAGGDIQVSGLNKQQKVWQVGVGSPFLTNEIIKVFNVTNNGIATSGNYIRGSHIYNPYNTTDKPKSIVSMTVIGPTVYDADRFATAAFAMGTNGIRFIEKLDGYEGYMIEAKGIATMTSGLATYIAS